MTRFDNGGVHDMNFIVSTPDGYFYPCGAGIAHTDEKDHAGHFSSADDAHVTAQLFGYLEGNYRVIPVDMHASRMASERAERYRRAAFNLPVGVVDGPISKRRHIRSGSPSHFPL
jgi:hypothetical protein